MPPPARLPSLSKPVSQAFTGTVLPSPCPALALPCRDANVLVFCAPHQFIHRIVKQLPGLVRKDAIAISLIKVGGLGGCC
jgi:glycerol-3-phosphate dehydrogenase